MTISLYKNYSENIRLDKELTLIQTMTGTLRDGTSIINPVIIIADPTDFRFNYMYIGEFGRYYFITDVKSVRNGVWEITGAVDVLTTYNAGIRNCNAIAKRNSNRVDAYLTDEFNKNYQNPNIVYKQFPNGYDNTNDSIILVNV